ncbi:MAG: LysM peptidoglycan-binding domain-containing protein [Nocardioides sp.]
MSHTAVLPAQHRLLDQFDAPSSYVPEYRLTRRGRLAVFVVALAVLIAVGVAFASGSVATDEKLVTETIVVAPGETLWEIASARAESGDVRSMMRYLEDLNGLESVALAAGQRLRVPVE